MRVRFFHPYPKYLQLRDLIRRRIGRELGVGDSLPPEPALATEFRVSRETVRAALRGLEAEGLLLRRPRVGTVISALPGHPEAGERLTGLVEDYTALGLNTDTTVLKQGLAVPPRDVAGELNIDPEAAVLSVERVRKLNGEPLAYHEAFIPYPLAKKIQGRDLSKLAIIHELERSGEPLVEEWQRISAVVADMTFARLLRIPLGAPLLVVTRRLRMRGERSSVLFRTHFRADRYYYTVALAPSAATRNARPMSSKRRRENATRLVPTTDEGWESNHG